MKNHKRSLLLRRTTAVVLDLAMMTQNLLIIKNLSKVRNRKAAVINLIAILTQALMKSLSKKVKKFKICPKRVIVLLPAAVVMRKKNNLRKTLTPLKRL